MGPHESKTTLYDTILISLAAINKFKFKYKNHTKSFIEILIKNLILINDPDDGNPEPPTFSQPQSVLFLFVCNQFLAFQ